MIATSTNADTSPSATTYNGETVGDYETYCTDKEDCENHSEEFTEKIIEDKKEINLKARHRILHPTINFIKRSIHRNQNR